MISGALLLHSESGKRNQNALCSIPVQNIGSKRQEANTALKPTPRGRRRGLISNVVPRAGRLILGVSTHNRHRIEEMKSMAWVYLLLAGFFEIGWPVGLKMAQEAETRIIGIIVAVAFMAISGFLLWLAQKEIPIGTAYAVWTGIGAAGTFVVGVLFYGDPSSLGRYLGVALIVAGVATLKLSH
jgi:quaternary ammonium compound-resistance protein SugE